MEETCQVTCHFYFKETCTNRKQLFQESLKLAKNGKVLFIMKEELTELPQLSQELTSENRQYLKMISFLYASDLDSLLESLSSLPEWQLVPSVLILDDLGVYCVNNCIQRACSIMALLLDSAMSCARSLKQSVSVLVSVANDNVEDEFCSSLSDLYSK